MLGEISGVPFVLLISFRKYFCETIHIVVVSSLRRSGARFSPRSDVWVQRQVNSCEIHGERKKVWCKFSPSFFSIGLLIIIPPLLRTYLSPLPKARQSWPGNTFFYILDLKAEASISDSALADASAALKTGSLSNSHECAVSISLPIYSMENVKKTNSGCHVLPHTSWRSGFNLQSHSAMCTDERGLFTWTVCVCKCLSLSF